MCPMCMTTALIAASGISSAGLLGFLTLKLRRKRKRDRQSRSA
jgi:hypothetical protein